MDGKIYVIGGCSSKYSTKDENYREVYDPDTQTWKPTNALPNLRSQKGASKICFVDSGFFSSTRSFLVETENMMCLVVRARCCSGLNWWSEVGGLEAISSNYLISVTNSGQDQRVLVWWKTNYYAEECQTEIWCAQILIEIWDHKILGCIVWSENVFTFQGCHDDDSEFLLHSALVKHDY
ncbi:hypothetical protein YC2023_078888 [Brassica napus]